MIKAIRQSRVFDALLSHKPIRLQRRSRHLVLRLRRSGRQVISRSSSRLTFTSELIRNPTTVGAICPSSRTLARVMAQQLKYVASNTGYVVELGAGTGIITAALLHAGLEPSRLIAIEQSSRLATHLRHRFPNIEVITGDACHLGELLGDRRHELQAVISGLPLRSLPPLSARAILHQVQTHLPSKGLFIRFTYDLRPVSQVRGIPMSCVASRIIWRNLPPARVDVFRPQSVQTFT
ncbi:MAG: methyltransferase domain-containing protein [Pseudomonadota bacterium]